MRQVHCDGCGFTEPNNMAKPNIKLVTMLVIKDPRFPSGTEKYEADLCSTCQGMVLHGYFRIRAEGRLELPAFINPKMLDNSA